MLKQLIQTTAALAAMTLSFNASAEAAWYAGPVSRVALVGDGIVVTLKTTALADCQYSYAYFHNPYLDPIVIKNAYAIALTSLTTGLEMGIVIDKAINGPGGQCNAIGMAADLRAR